MNIHVLPAVPLAESPSPHHRSAYADATCASQAVSQSCSVCRSVIRRSICQSVVNWVNQCLTVLVNQQLVVSVNQSLTVSVLNYTCQPIISCVCQSIVNCVSQCLTVFVNQPLAVSVNLSLSVSVLKLYFLSNH